MSSAYKTWEGVRKPSGPTICRIFLSFTSLERPLLRTSSTRQKSIGDKGSPCLTLYYKEKNSPDCHLL